MASPLSIIIFGASGDLSCRKLIPSLYRLFCKDRLPKETRIIGVARSPWTDQEFRDKVGGCAQEFTREDWQPQKWASFAQDLLYVPGDAAKPAGLERLQARLRDLEGSDGGRRLYYLAVAPQLYPEIATRLGEAGMSQEDGSWRRLVIEKPFGHDLASARALNQTLH